MLIESIGDLLRMKEIEKRVISINLNDEGETLRSEDEADFEAALKVKVTKLKKKKDFSTKRGSIRAQSASRERLSGASNPRIPNRHQMCC